DALAVLELEEFLDRLAVARAGGAVDDARGVADAEAGGERSPRTGRAGQGREHRVAFTQAGAREVAHFLLSFHPAVAGDDHDVVFRDDEVFSRVFGFVGDALDPGESFGAVLRGDVLDLVAHDGPATLLVLEQGV